jgi:putative DNA primase/helicase
MNFAQTIDFDALMEPVALRLLGEPVQKHGDEWRYGNRGSLAVDIGKGRWFDHEANEGGGVFDLIRRQGHEHPAAWLRREGLMAQPHVVSRTKPKIVATYDYTDENGSLLFQVVRFDPKDFRQRRSDGRGGWVWNLQDTRRVPYRLPELMKAVAAGETVYIPEGEKDADNLRAVGLAATTNPGGCKKWRDDYSEHLRGADVIVLPDNHSEGREHGDQIVASLHGTAKRIRVLDIGKHWSSCPDKGDVSDWLAAGGSVEKLKAVADALPEAVA